jgi:glucose/arabinose dehydrogenase/PKD repeat protein
LSFRRPVTKRSLSLAFACVFAAVALSFLGEAPGFAEPFLPLGFTDQFIAHVDTPTSITATPDGRILVTSQGGAVRVIKDDVLSPTIALDIAARVCSNVERGVESVAVDPEFAVNHFIYVYYTVKGANGCGTTVNKHPVNRVSRFVLPNSSVVNPASEVVLIDNIENVSGNHNGGDLQFGKDNLLYVSVGDGGCDYANDSGCGGQNDASRDKNTLLGKILRVTRDGAIPAGNPYTGALSASCAAGNAPLDNMNCRETYASGLRNPFRTAFDPNATTTRFYINDVGQDRWEEVDLGQAGADYGWNLREGPCVTASYTNCGPAPKYVNPIFSYPHTSGCSAITAGAFVPDGIGWPPSFTGKYLFGDYTCGAIFRLETNGTSTPTFTGIEPGGPIAMQFLPYGSGTALYYTTYANGGEVHRIAFTSDGTPVASMTVDQDAGGAPLVVAFDGSASRDPNEQSLTYHWTFGDGGSATTTSATTSHTYVADGVYTASLRVEDPDGHLSTPFTLTITVGNSRPDPTITSPVAGDTFWVGRPITLTGTAVDEEDGALGDTSLSWRVLLHHNDHTHPFFGPVTGNNVVFSAPQPENLTAAANSYLEIYLTATDSGGLSRTVEMDMQPRKVALTFATQPKGLNVVVQGVTFVAPVTITSWDNWSINVNAPNKSGYVFLNWSDGGAQSHTIVTPDVATKYVAKYLKIV